MKIDITALKYKVNTFIDLFKPPILLYVIYYSYLPKTNSFCHSANYSTLGRQNVTHLVGHNNRLLCRNAKPQKGQQLIPRSDGSVSKN